MAMIGDVEVTVVSEVINRSSQVTSRKVEGGVVSDNVQREQDTIDISGMVGLDGWPALKQLRDYQRAGTTLTYSGRNIVNDVVIQRLNTDHGLGTQGGFKFDCTLVQVQIAETKLVSVQAARNIQSQVKPTTNGGTQRPVLKSRDTDRKNELIGRYAR